MLKNGTGPLCCCRRKDCCCWTKDRGLLVDVKAMTVGAANAMTLTRVLIVMMKMSQFHSGIWKDGNLDGWIQLFVNFMIDLRLDGTSLPPNTARGEHTDN
mmetsp:Transcript_19743/g.41125  ORF Transcript_19743/g.41125 Transcript_19743/m.41125 type:complete len:100 (+) Transcript_19743:778-1077(+)